MSATWPLIVAAVVGWTLLVLVIGHSKIVVGQLVDRVNYWHTEWQKRNDVVVSLTHRLDQAYKDNLLLREQYGVNLC